MLGHVKGTAIFLINSTLTLAPEYICEFSKLFLMHQLSHLYAGKLFFILIVKL